MIDTVQQELVQAEPVPLETIDVLDLLLTLCQVWRQILLGGAIGLTLAVLYAFLLAKPTYTATAIILPPQQSQSSASALLGSLNALSGIAGASGLGLKSPGVRYSELTSE